MKVTVYRPKEVVGLGPPKAFLGEDHPEQGDWVQSAKAELPEADQPPRLLLLGRAFLIYSMYHVRDPHFMGIAIQNFAAAARMLGYNLPLKEDDGCWLTYGPEGFDPALPRDFHFMLDNIAAVFGDNAAKQQAQQLHIDWQPEITGR
jgi:hypothetical protein